MNCYTSKGGNKYYCLNLINPNYTYNYNRTDNIGYLYCEKDNSVNILHREDGPAIEDFNGYQEWCYHGEKIHCKDNEEFLKIIKMKAFI